MDIHFDELASFVFQNNPLGRKFAMSIEGVQSGKDLFFFLLDLVCKGLVLMYGSNGNTVDLSTIDDAMFQKIASCLLCAGIVVSIARTATLPDNSDSSNSSVPDSSDRPLDSSDRPAEINMPELLTMPDHLALEKYVLKMRMPPSEITLSFAFHHSAMSHGWHCGHN